jgi:hypothetical protein
MKWQTFAECFYLPEKKAERKTFMLINFFIYIFVLIQTFALFYVKERVEGKKLS